MTFEKWLSLHIKCEDAIGDLARDYKFMCNENRANGVKRERLTLDHLYRNNACDSAINAFHTARNLYATFLTLTGI